MFVQCSKRSSAPVNILWIWWNCAHGSLGCNVYLRDSTESVDVALSLKDLPMDWIKHLDREWGMKDIGSFADLISISFIPKNFAHKNVRLEHAKGCHFSISFICAMHACMHLQYWCCQKELRICSAVYQVEGWNAMTLRNLKVFRGNMWSSGLAIFSLMCPPRPCRQSLENMEVFWANQSLPCLQGTEALHVHSSMTLVMLIGLSMHWTTWLFHLWLAGDACSYHTR